MTDASTPAQWLIAEYEAVAGEWGLWDFDPEDASAACPGPGQTVYAQPIFTLKDAMDGGDPMCVIAGDYRDHDRWWI